MNISLELVQHYPWLPSLRIYYSNLGSKHPIDFISEIFDKYPSGELQIRISEFFKSAFEGLEQFNYFIDELNVYMYILIKILLRVFNNKRISNRIANLYSKITYKKLSNESEYNLYIICEDLKLKILYQDPPWKFGINLIKDQQEILKTNFKIHYIDYLELASKLQDEYRKLINNPLSEGYVFIKNNNLARLIQEFARNKFLEGDKSDTVEIEAFKKIMLQNDGFKELYDDISSEWKIIEEEFRQSPVFEFEKGKDYSGIQPPCMKEILQKAQEGQNIIHNERLFLVWFLLSLNYLVEDVVDVFSTMPDFNRERTTYQVKFAKKKEYTPYKCSTLKSLSLCMATRYKDELCLKGYYSKKDKETKKISHPLSYINTMQYRASRNININKNKNKNDKNQSNKEK